ncbi:MAG: nitrogen fixation protein NifT [Rhodospirillaceae bacterium]|nr:MAG: nitrogen fixation protein NifT [Rhodospirillaceae bacterium]
MKVMIRRQGETFSAYIAKKDLEETIVAMEKPGLWGGWIRLANGALMDLPDMAADTPLPITVTARKKAPPP